jgi:hypothetical protein
MREGYRSIRRSTALLTLSALLIACGPSPNAGSTEERTPSSTLSTCTADIDRTNGHACAEEGMACDYPFTCEAFSQLARCTCKDGRFACTDSSGDVAPGSPPQCVRNAPPSTEACPATMADASGVTCDTLGRACFYRGDLCPETPAAIRRFDYCQCARSVSGSMAYVCTKAVCASILQE